MDAMELAQSGAAALVTAMATDAWKNASQRLAALFSRPDGGPTEHETILLEGCREALVDTPPATTRADVEVILRALLLDRITDDELFAGRVQALVEESAGRGTVNQSTKVGAGGQSYQAGRDLTIGTPPA